MKDRALLLGGLLALLVGFAGLLGTATAMATGRGTMHSPGDRNVPYDLRFLNEMIVHHQGAVMSSKMMIADSKRPEMRRLADSIVKSQTEQIEQMRAWRQEWYGNGAAGSGTRHCEQMMDAMTGMEGMMDNHEMHGTMGGDMDHMFLRMMIPHHRLAIEMSEGALAKAEHQELKDLARTIIRDQTAEIELMEGYLKAWYDEEAPDDTHGMMGQ